LKIKIIKIEYLANKNLENQNIEKLSEKSARPQKKYGDFCSSVWSFFKHILQVFSFQDFDFNFQFSIF
jgi:hypothetical protein